MVSVTSHCVLLQVGSAKSYEPGARWRSEGPQVNAGAGGQLNSEGFILLLL